MDTPQSILLDALRRAASHQAELRLFRSGKLPGLFPARTAVNTAVAAEALREGLIEVLRSETKGKTTTDWVRITAKGIDFAVQHDSPARALDELKDALAISRDNLPGWIAQMRRELDTLGKQFLAEVDQIGKRLDQLAGRVDGVLGRIAASGVATAQAAPLPWAQPALDYLAGRGRLTGQPRCPLPELFAALRQRAFELRIMDFHSGLRRLQAEGTLQLFPCDETSGPAEPEYALPDGGTVLYYAQRLAG